MRLRSSTNFISLGLACLTLSLVLMAHSLGIAPDDANLLLRARVQTAELVAAQCSPAAKTGDVNLMTAILRQVAVRNADLTSAGLRGADGKLVYAYGPHEKTWGLGGTRALSSIVKLSVPITADNGDWGRVEFCFPHDTATLPRFVPQFLRGWLGNPAIRLGSFMATAGFICYSLYLRRTLRHLDPSAVIPPRVRAMLDALAEGVVVLDKNGRIVMANDAFSRITGLPGDGLQGIMADRLGWTRPHSDEAAGNIPWMQVLSSGQPVKGAPLGLRVSTPASEKGPDNAQDQSEQLIARVFSVNAAPVLGPDSSVRGALATFDDVTSIEKRNNQLRRMLDKLKKSRDEIDQKNRELQFLAMTDSLTGCLNRRAFFSNFEGHWSAARRHGQPLAAVMLDVDYFKKINDRHGHAVGDQVLQRVAAVLKDLSRKSDVVCRYGGEEFCVLLPHTDLKSARQMAQRFRKVIEEVPLGGIAVTVSLGVSAIAAGATSPQELLNQADQALYAAKRGGRNRVETWDPTMAAAAPPERADSRSSAGPSAEPISFRAVAALMSALAQRDKGTAAHSRRVADLCVAAAQGFMSVSDCFILETAALLHDIGKLGVPDSILLKPGPLSDEEWKVMRMHERLGAEIVAATFNSPELTEIVRTHHSFYGRADGDNDAPAGEKIPLGSRILTIVDAYDAMVNDRPYKKGRSKAEALAELRRCAGTQFDPALVERVAEVLDARTETQSGSPIDQLFAGLQRDLERLAVALDAQDLALLTAMAGRFSVNASRDGLEHISTAAKELAKAASGEADLVEVIKRLNELMDLCRTAPGADTVDARPLVEETALATT